MTVAVVVERRYLDQAQPAGLVAALRDRGVAVQLVEADSRVVRVDDNSWLAGVDVVVVRGRSTTTLVIAACAECAGVPTVNGRAATEAVRNKAEMAVVLADAGIPTPLTFVGGSAALAATLSDDAYPVVLKPVFGDNSRGLRLVADRHELAATPWPEPVALAQRFLPSDGRDLKLYVIARRVFAVRKPSPFRAIGARCHVVQPPPEPVPVTLALRELALRCGRAFGLELFGVDCIEGPGGPWVIEVNEFPNYTGVARVGDLLADHVLTRAASPVVQRTEPVGEMQWIRR